MKGDAVINGHMPKRGDYLVHRDRGRTYGLVWEVRNPVFHGDEAKGTLVCERGVRVAWRSFTTASLVPSDPETLRMRGYEWSTEPLDDYTDLEQRALRAAEAGRYSVAEVMFTAAGNDEAAAICQEVIR